MNDLEKRSFYSFLSLYIISSSFFIILSGHWYFVAQESALKSNDYFQMRHISDQVSSAIIQAQMKETALHLPDIDPAYHISLIDDNGTLLPRSEPITFKVTKNDYFQWHTQTVLVSDSPQEHLGVAFVVVRSDRLHKALEVLKKNVASSMLLVALITILIAWALSKLFIRPLHRRVEQIERFISDITHELNTPVTALRMATERARQKTSYDAKTIRNISISTKQLSDIYRSLTYLQFTPRKRESIRTDIHEALLKSILYYQELCESKRIRIDVESEPFVYPMTDGQTDMLFGNLISNAVKYSMPGSEIDIVLRPYTFTIKDHGIGIEKEKLSKIFERYDRETGYAGGFGVGLSIVKEICDENAIDIHVASEPGNGTVFTLSFDKKRS